MPTSMLHPQRGFTDSDAPIARSKCRSARTPGGVIRFAEDCIGKAFERGEGSAHADVLLTADLGIEQDRHARFAGEFDEVHRLSLSLHLIHGRQKSRS